MKTLKFLTLISILFGTFVACMDNTMSAAEKAAEKQRKEEQAEYHLLDSIVGDLATIIRFDHSRGGNGMYISDGFRQHRVIDTTIKINSFIKDMTVKIRYSDPSVCNYDNTKILLDGKEIKGEQDPDPYGGLIFKDIFEKQDETHRIEILSDSAKCGNLKESYTLVPSKNPGQAHFTEVCYSPEDGYYIKGHFYSMVIPCYYGGFYSTYADSLQSKCILKTESESMELKIDFEKDYDIMNARYYQKGYVSLDSTTLVNFLKEDTSATLSCALIFQDWFVPAQVNREFKYYERTLKFKEMEKARLLDVRSNQYSLLTVEPYNFTSYLFTRTTVKGEKIFAHKIYGTYSTTDLGIMHEIRWKDVYNGLIDESTTEDSVQVLVVAWPSGSTTQEEMELVEKLRELTWDQNADIFETTLDSIMNVVTDEAGNIKEQFYYMDAKRVPGYDINDYKDQQ